MREDVQNEDSFRFVVNPCDESVDVSADIEYGSPTHDVSMSKIAPHVGKGVPVGPLGDAVPVHQ